MKYVYPAVFHPNDDGSVTVSFPDLPGCITEGRGTDGALQMAQDAMTQWINAAAELKKNLLPPSQITAVSCKADEFTSLVCAEVKDGSAVRRTVSLPKWMDDKASEAGLSLSRILQEALKMKFNL